VDRVNRGWLDPKDLFVWQAYDSPDRLPDPLVRSDGELVEASWDEAMGRIIERSKQRVVEKGPLALGFYTSGQLFLEEYYTLAVIGKAGLGPPHMDGNTRLCAATAAAIKLFALRKQKHPRPRWQVPLAELGAERLELPDH